MRVRHLAVCVLLLVLLVPVAFGQSATVQPRTGANLLICSWNIKWFRNTGRDLTKLAKVIAKFDLCGIIELQSDSVMEDLAAALQTETGEPWIYIQSNHTGHASYREQFAFIWRDAKVRLASGHVGNVADLGNIYRHEPYIGTFRSGNLDFRFLLIHTRWTTAQAREAEVEQIAQDFLFFQNLTREKDVIVGGDFNYSDGAAQMQPLRDLPHIRNLVPSGTKTTLKASGEGFSSWYDHLFVNAQATTEATGRGNAYNFVSGLGYTDTQKARREVSDHLPVWAEFRTDGPDDD